MGKFERMGIAKSLGMSEAELGKLMNANAGDLKGIMADREKQAKTQAELAENQIALSRIHNSCYSKMEKKRKKPKFKI